MPADPQERDSGSGDPGAPASVIGLFPLAAQKGPSPPTTRPSFEPLHGPPSSKVRVRRRFGTTMPPARPNPPKGEPGRAVISVAFLWSLGGPASGVGGRRLPDRARHRLERG